MKTELGPRFYLEDKDFEVEAGDAVEVTGSRTLMAGRPTLIARELRRGDYTLALRNDNGTPLWARGAGTGKPASSMKCPCCRRGMRAGRSSQ